MAAKATSVYVSVAVKGDPFAIVAKQQFFNAKEMRVWLAKTKEQYPEDKYRYTKETY